MNCAKRSSVLPITSELPRAMAPGIGVRQAMGTVHVRAAVDYRV